MRKQIISILLLILTNTILFSQESYQEKYLELLNNNDLTALNSLLKEWEKVEPRGVVFLHPERIEQLTR